MFDCVNDFVGNCWLCTIVTASLAVIVYHCVWRTWSFFSNRNVKFVRGLPIIGSAYRTVLGWEPGAISYQRCYDAFPNEKFIGIYETFGTPTYLIRDPDLVQQLTINDFDHFANHRTQLQPNIDPMMDRALFFVHDERWRQLRAEMVPNFSAGRMRAMHELIVRYTENFVSTLDDVNCSNASRQYDAKKLISLYANDIIATAIFGVELNSLKDPKKEFYKMGKAITDVGLMGRLKFMAGVNFPTVAKALKLRIISDQNADYMLCIVAESIAERRNHKSLRNDFIDSMMNATENQHNDTHDDEAIDIGFSVVKEQQSHLELERTAG